mgnify:CR=1 FL=1
MIKFRTINQAFAEIKAADPGTAVTKHAIRRAVLAGDIPSRKTGSRFLVSLDKVIEYFSGGGEADA